jgi:hypothetical protein
LGIRWGKADVHSATTTDGQTASSSSGNFLVEHTITAQTGVTQELMVRRIDDENTWIVRLDNSSMKLISKSSGSETEQASVAAVLTAGVDYRVLVIMDDQGSSHNQRAV